MKRPGQRQRGHAGTLFEQTHCLLLSPHVDDAAFSLGAALLDGRFPGAIIVTVFSASDYATTAAAGNETRVTRLRRREDDMFFAGARGIVRRYLGWRDAPLRLRIPWRTVCDPRGSRSGEAEVRALAAIIGDRPARGTNRMVLAPLGLGGHIDHLVVRRAACRLARDGAAVGFYEELPYARALSLAAIATSVARFARTQRMTLVPHVIAARDRGDVKREALREYRSQLGRHTLRRIVDHGARLTRGGWAERLWLNRAAANLLATRIDPREAPP